MKKKRPVRMILLFTFFPLLMAGCGKRSVEMEERTIVHEGSTASSEPVEKTCSTSAATEIQPYSTTESHNVSAESEDDIISESAESFDTASGLTGELANQNGIEQERQNDIEIEIRNWMDTLEDVCKKEDTETLSTLFDPIYSVEDAYQNAWEIQKLNEDYTVEAREEEDGVIAFLQGTLKDSGEETGVYLSFCRKEGKLIFDYRIISNHICGNCGGAGQIYQGGQPCGICGGTGQVWVDNVFYDGIQWQGQWQACGGCGGVGYIGAVNETCGMCGGTGLNW